MDMKCVMTLKASNEQDRERLAAFAKEVNEEVQYTEDGLCRIEDEEDDERIGEFVEFARRAAARFPQMDLTLILGSKVIDSFMYVNNNGVLEQREPGIIRIYVEAPSDYEILKACAGQCLDAQGFVMRTNDDRQTISWECEYKDEAVKSRCDAAIAAISGAMPTVRLVCYTAGLLWPGDGVDDYCYATGGSFEWKPASPKWCHLISDDYEFYPISETVSDPLRTFEKMLETARSGNRICDYDLLMILADEEDHDLYWSRLRPEDAAWIRNYADKDDFELLPVFEECERRGWSKSKWL